MKPTPLQGDSLLEGQHISNYKTYMSREKASVNFSERLVSSTRHGNDNFVRAAKAISAISKWQDTDHL